MQKFVICLLCILIAVGLNACIKQEERMGLEQDKSIESHEQEGRPFLNAQTSVFQSLEVENGKTITAYLDVYLSETDADFLFIELKEEAKAIMRYTYTTDDEEGVQLGIRSEEDGKVTSFELKAAAEQAYDAVWLEETVSLKKGMNKLYLSGDDRTCKMICEIVGLDSKNAVYISAFPKDQ